MCKTCFPSDQVVVALIGVEQVHVWHGTAGAMCKTCFPSDKVVVSQCI